MPPARSAIVLRKLGGEAQTGQLLNPKPPLRTDNEHYVRLIAAVLAIIGELQAGVGIRVSAFKPDLVVQNADDGGLASLYA